MPAQPDNQGLPSVSRVKGKRWLFLLIVIAIICLAAGVAFYFFSGRPFSFSLKNYKLKSFLNNLKTQTSALEYPSGVWKDRLEESYSKVLTDSDSAKQFEALNTSFEILSKMYLLNPDKKNREALESLKSYLMKNYQENYGEEKFNILCLDDGCNFPAPPDEITELTSSIEKLASIDEGIKKNALQAIKNASVYKEPSEKWSFYDSAFQLLKSEYKKDNSNGELGSILEKLAAYIKSNFQEDYEHIIKLNGENDRYKL